MVDIASSDVWFESRAGSVDTDVTFSFGRTVDTGPGTNGSVTCSIGNTDVTQCGLPEGTVIEVGERNGSVQVWFDPKLAGLDMIGVFDCHAEKLNRSMSLKTIFLNQNGLLFSYSFFILKFIFLEVATCSLPLGQWAQTGFKMIRFNTLIEFRN